MKSIFIFFVLISSALATPSPLILEESSSTIGGVLKLNGLSGINDSTLRSVNGGAFQLLINNKVKFALGRAGMGVFYAIESADEKYGAKLLLHGKSPYSPIVMSNYGGDFILQSSGKQMVTIKETGQISVPKGPGILLLGEESHYYLENSNDVFHVRKSSGEVVLSATSDNLLYGGTIKAKKIIVSQENWPDYVFENDYELRSLEEVESHIFEKKHLPEIPNAKLIEEEGVDLSELVKLQMKKIEELTLYAIEQNKKINTLEQKMNLLIKD